MRRGREKNYWENRRSLQAAADEMLSHMKGYDWSFRQAVTDKKKNFSDEKLHALVDEMMTGWKEDLRDGRYEDVSGPYIEAREEILRKYLYLVMRCSLCRDAYSHVCNGSGETERTDFAFLLEQARRFFRDWCVMTGENGKRRNEPHSGYDRHFGFHLYRPFHEFADEVGNNTGVDFSLIPEWKLADRQPERFWTDEGRNKPIDIIRPGKGPLVRHQAENPAECEDPDGQDEQDEQDEQDVEIDDDWDDFVDLEDDYDFWSYRTDDYYDALSEADNRREGLKWLWMNFDCMTEYFTACEEFKSLFEKAAPAVMYDFCENLESIVDLFLLKREVPPLIDIDKMLNVYSSFRDGALRQAKRYGRAVQWKEL